MAEVDSLGVFSALSNVVALPSRERLPLGPLVLEGEGATYTLCLSMPIRGRSSEAKILSDQSHRPSSARHWALAQCKQPCSSDIMSPIHGMYSMGIQASLYNVVRLQASTSDSSARTDRSPTLSPLEPLATPSSRTFILRTHRLLSEVGGAKMWEELRKPGEPGLPGGVSTLAHETGVTGSEELCAAVTLSREVDAQSGAGAPAGCEREGTHVLGRSVPSGF